MIDLKSFAAATTLENGMAVTIRAIRSDDKEMLRAAFNKLDRSSIYTRFFGYKKDLSEAELEQATNVDFDTVTALVVTAVNSETETLIGAGRYARVGEFTAEVAFTVEEDYQGLGVASLLLRQLVDIAREKGLRRFEAEVLAQNLAMLAVFRHSGLPMRQQPESGVVHVTLGLQPQEN
jgi:RimJ/RimL family protein N-acetyltransferase